MLSFKQVLWYVALSPRDLLEEKNNQMKGREERIAELEKEIADILGRNNILMNEKERMKQHEKVRKSNICTNLPVVILKKKWIFYKKCKEKPDFLDNVLDVPCKLEKNTWTYNSKLNKILENKHILYKG